MQLGIEHHFTNATLSIWFDEKLIYTRPLHGEVKKKLLVVKGVEGYSAELLPVSSGEHHIRVRVQSSYDSYDGTASITVTLPPNGERTLLIEADKHKAVQLTLQ